MYATLNINKAAQVREALLLDREKTLEDIYAKTFPMVLHYVKLHKGTSEDAKDLLQEAIILFYEKLMQGDFNLTSSVSTYLMAICKNLWRTQSRKRSHYTNITPETTERFSEEPKDDVQASLPILNFVEQLGARCKEILVAFYYHHQKMDQIASRYNYSSTHTATVQKFKCLERLRKSLATFSVHQFLN